jgi:DNA-binding NarL/FixJ family response regulator
MINIAIIDQNETYSSGLKTLLEQIDGFSVVSGSAIETVIQDPSNFPFHIVLIDNSFGIAGCNKMIREIISKAPKVKILILVMFSEELGLDYGSADVILKSSGKKEFENRIKNFTGN